MNSLELVKVEIKSCLRTPSSSSSQPESQKAAPTQTTNRSTTAWRSELGLEILAAHCSY